MRLRKLPDRIDKRWLLGLICGAHLACLLVAGWWYLVRLERRMVEVMQQDVLASSRNITDTAITSLARIRSHNAAGDRPRSVEEYLTALASTTAALEGGTLSVYELKSGQRIDISNVTPDQSAALLAALAPTASQEVRAELDDLKLAIDEHFGWTGGPDGRSFAYARDVPALGLRLVIDQPKREMRMALTDILSTVRSAATLVVLLVLICGAALTGSLIYRYEDRLSAMNASLAETVEQRTSSLRRTRDVVIFGLARVAESRDHDTGEHLERIRRYSELLAIHMAPEHPEITPEFIARLGLASSLHDIGKVAIPDAVLLKPGELEPAERQLIQQHTVLGGDCLLAIRQRLEGDQLIELACQIAYTHHEKWDGTGYPFGLSGVQIPLAARIVALADSYDAITSRRVYKAAISHDEACEIIARSSGTHFDPQVVAAFQAIHNRFRQTADEINQSSQAAAHFDRAEVLGVSRPAQRGFVETEHPHLAEVYEMLTSEEPQHADNGAAAHYGGNGHGVV